MEQFFSYFCIPFALSHSFLCHIQIIWHTFSSNTCLQPNFHQTLYYCGITLPNEMLNRYYYYNILDCICIYNYYFILASFTKLRFKMFYTKVCSLLEWCFIISMEVSNDHSHLKCRGFAGSH